MPAYWIGMNAITGPSEAWFLSSYASNEALEKENDAMEAAVGKQLEAADEGDAQFRTGTRMYLLELNESLSYRMRPNVKDMRYISVATVRVKPGYGQAFLEVRKAVKAAHEKANVDEHWAFYEVTSGAPAGTYMLLFGSSTMKDDDTDPHTAAYRDAVGDEGRAKYQEFQRAGLASHRNGDLRDQPEDEPCARRVDLRSARLLEGPVDQDHHGRPEGASRRSRIAGQALTFASMTGPDRESAEPRNLTPS